MSYTSKLGPSPFLTVSRHHYHPTPNESPIYPHYRTNSYTNVPTYLASFANPAEYGEQKYFQKEMITMIPGVSNLQNQDQQKLLHPLNTYSGNVFDIHRVGSPFDRGEIYYGTKDPKQNTFSQSTSFYTLNDSIDNVQGKKQNPFNKKYLLSEKNRQLQTYALYSHDFYGTQLSRSEQENNHKRNQRQKRNLQKKLTTKTEIEKLDNLNDSNEGYRTKMKTQTNYLYDDDDRYGGTYAKKNDNDRTRFDGGYQNGKGSSQKAYEYLVESRVDQKQFGSFGQGKQFSGQKIDQGQSLIVDLARITSNESKDYRTNVNGERTKRQPVYFESQDDERKSGTFKVPDVIIEEINNPRIPSTVLKGRKDTIASSVINEKISQERQRVRTIRQEAVQAGRNPPGQIFMRGKVYDKISL